jgi:hypothetical protein
MTDPISRCSPTTETTLLPCPFCASATVGHGYKGPGDGSGVRPVVFCAACSASVEGATFGVCIVRWNTRPATPEAPGDVAEIVPDRGTIASLIRERFDPCPDLGQASYKAFEDSWNDGAEEIADAILALMPAPSSAETADLLKANQILHTLISSRDARLAEAVELIEDMAEAITAEVNEKGGGGSILARLSDARRFLVGGS